VDLKNAFAVCLISLFSATLVVLIARSLDSQAASQLEPQLTAIAEELQALRRQGGVAASAGESAEDVDDALIVYYFHGSFRCPDCTAVRMQTKAILDADFGPQLNAGEVVWKVLNYEKPVGKRLAARFEIKDPVVVLAKMKAGKIERSNRLDKCKALVGDKKAFQKYVRDAVKAMLTADKPAASAAATKVQPASQGPPDVPIPE
jgi:hypothetical protein